MIRRIVLHTILAALLIGASGALYQTARQDDGIAGPGAILAPALAEHRNDHGHHDD